MTVKDLLDGGSQNEHGPVTDPRNATTGALMFVEALPDVTDYSHDTAEVSSGFFQNSGANCRFEFWYYMAGDSGALMPVIVHSDTEVNIYIVSCHYDVTI